MAARGPSCLDPDGVPDGGVPGGGGPSVSLMPNQLARVTRRPWAALRARVCGIAALYWGSYCDEKTPGPDKLREWILVLWWPPSRPSGTGPEPAPPRQALSVHNGFSFVTKKTKKKKLYIGLHRSVKVLFPPMTIPFFSLSPHNWNHKMPTQLL